MSMRLNSTEIAREDAILVKDILKKMIKDSELSQPMMTLGTKGD